MLADLDMSIQSFLYHFKVLITILVLFLVFMLLALDLFAVNIYSFFLLSTRELISSEIFSVFTSFFMMMSF